MHLTARSGVQVRPAWAFGESNVGLTSDVRVRKWVWLRIAFRIQTEWPLTLMGGRRKCVLQKADKAQ